MSKKKFKVLLKFGIHFGIYFSHIFIWDLLQIIFFEHDPSDQRSWNKKCERIHVTFNTNWELTNRTIQFRYSFQTMIVKFNLKGKRWNPLYFLGREIQFPFSPKSNKQPREMKHLWFYLLSNVAIPQPRQKLKDFEKMLKLSLIFPQVPSFSLLISPLLFFIDLVSM